MDKKRIIAMCFEISGLNKLLFNRIKKKTKNNYIRVVNYHEIYKNEISQFEEHLQLFGKLFENCNYEDFKKFLAGEKVFYNKPGIMITFDDGFVGNYMNAAPLLEKYGFSGYFFVSYGLLDQDKYMSKEQILGLRDRGHYIGSHTYTHHRMNLKDNEEVLQHEIFESKIALQRLMGTEVEIFCWVGGEKGTYTRCAFEKIKEAGYRYSMMTNSYPVFKECNPLTIQRTNIQAWWSCTIVKFQISGAMDYIYRKKRKNEESLC